MLNKQRQGHQVELPVIARFLREREEQASSNVDGIAPPSQ